MYIEPTGPLEQGDLIRSIPIPYLQEEGDKIALIAKGQSDPEKLDQTPPTQALCDDTHNKVFCIATRTMHLLVLSQSCDLARIDEGGAGRILVAPIIDETEDDNIQNQFKTGQAEALGKKVWEAALSNDKNAESVLKKGVEGAEKVRDSYLTNVWLGRIEGAFPLAKRQVGAFTLPRSICYFANIVSLPRTWYALLKERRVLGLDTAWRSVLQEHLAGYFGRFAFPGTEKDRLAVGEIGKAASAEPVRAAEPVKATAEPLAGAVLARGSAE